MREIVSATVTALLRKCGEDPRGRGRYFKPFTGKQQGKDWTAALPHPAHTANMGLAPKSQS